MATKRFVVTGEQEATFHVRRRELEKQLFDVGAVDPEIVIAGLQLLLEGKAVKEDLDNTRPAWIAAILDAERTHHLSFFGREFDLAEFEKTLRRYGRKKIKAWQNLGLEPHFLPSVCMMSGDDYPGWKVKPETWFYKKQLEGKLFLDTDSTLEKVLTVWLKGITVLIDTRLKPAYRDGKQMWEGDNLFGLLIADLRKEKKISKYEYGPQSSRFGVSADEWQEYIRPALAARLGLELRQVRLECAIEANTIPQLYPHMPRKADGKTDTSVWHEEYFEGRGDRLGGGDSGVGGLAHVSANVTGRRWRSRSFRPLAVL